MSRQKPKCQGKSNLYAFSCDRNATIFLDGKGYCWQHSPIRAATATRSRNATQLVATDDKAPGFSRGVVYSPRSDHDAGITSSGIPLVRTETKIGLTPDNVEQAAFTLVDEKYIASPGMIDYAKRMIPQVQRVAP